VELLLLIVVPSFMVVGYFRLHRASVLIVAVLSIPLAYLGFDLLGRDPASIDYGEQILPYLLAALIMAVVIGHCVGWTVRRIQIKSADKLRDSRIGETPQ
jgi:hypothetical protein